MNFHVYQEIGLFTGRAYFLPKDVSDNVRFLNKYVATNREELKGCSVKIYRNWVGCLISIFNKAVKITLTDSTQVYVNANSLYQNYFRFKDNVKTTEGSALIRDLGNKYINYKGNYSKADLQRMENELERALPSCSLKTRLEKVVNAKDPKELTIDQPTIEPRDPNSNPKIDSDKFNDRIKDYFQNLDDEKNIGQILDNINIKLKFVETFESDKIQGWCAFLIKTIERIPIEKFKAHPAQYKLLQEKLIPKLTECIKDDINYAEIFMNFMYNMEFYKELAEYIKKYEEKLEGVKVDRACEYFQKILKLKEAIPAAAPQGLEPAQEKEEFDFANFEYFAVLKFLYRKGAEKLNDFALRCKGDDKVVQANKILITAQSLQIRNMLDHFRPQVVSELSVDGTHEQWDTIVKIVTGKLDIVKYLTTIDSKTLNILLLLYQYFPEVLNNKKIVINVNADNILAIWNFTRRTNKFLDLEQKCRIFLSNYTHRPTSLRTELKGWDTLSEYECEKLQVEILEETQKLKKLKGDYTRDPYPYHWGKLENDMHNKVGYGTGFGFSDDLIVQVDRYAELKQLSNTLQIMGATKVEIGSIDNGYYYTNFLDMTEHVKFIKENIKSLKELEIKINPLIGGGSLKELIQLVKEHKNLKIRVMQCERTPNGANAANRIAQCEALLVILNQDEKDRIFVKGMYENGALLPRIYQ